MAYFGQSSRFAGDPGWFDSLKRIGRRAIRTGFALVTGGPIAAAQVNIPQRSAPIFTPPFVGQINPVVEAAAIALGTGLGTVVAQRSSAGVAVAPHQHGVHLNKSDYFLSDGTFVPKGSRMVANRSRNPYNKKAATRAASRLKSLGRGMKTIRKSVKAAAKELG